jgi:hypothetical protein
VFELLRGKHLLVVGHSVHRHVVIALHGLLLRPPIAAAVGAVQVRSADLDDAQSSIWPAHGFASAEFDERRLLNDKCKESQRKLRLPASVVNSCVAARKPKSDTVGDL